MERVHDQMSEDICADIEGGRWSEDIGVGVGRLLDVHLYVSKNKKFIQCINIT